MKLRDKIMYFGSSTLAAIALALYFFLTPPIAKAQCNGCLDANDNCWPVGYCSYELCLCPEGGQICIHGFGNDYHWGQCNSCADPYC